MRFLATLLLLAPSLALAQPTGSTVIAGGGSGSDTGERVAADLWDGRHAVAGTFEQTATFGGVAITSADAPASRSDAFVVLYEADGTALWARRMGTDIFNDFGAGVALDNSFNGASQGSVYVSGYFTGIATFDGGDSLGVTLTTRSDFDAFLAKYSPEGDLVWVQQAGGAQQDTGRDVVVDGEGNVYWAGSFTGTSTWGSGDAAQTRTSAGSSDGFLARYAPDGTLTWLLTTGGLEGDDLRGLATDIFTESIYATGTFRGVSFFGETPLQSRGLSDAAVLAVDAATGTVAWARQVGGSGNDYARGVAVHWQGGIAAVGSFENQILVGATVLTSAGFSDVFAAFYTPEGTERGAVRGGGPDFDIANGVAGTPLVPVVTRGGPPSVAPVFVVTGYVDGASTFGDTALPAQGLDAFAAVFVDEGPSDSTPPPLTDVFAVGGTNADHGFGAAIGTGANFSNYGSQLFLTGSFRGAVTLGSTTVMSAGSGDVFVASVPLCPAYACFPVAADPAPEADLALRIAPNPARGASRLSLTLAVAAPATVEVIDALGRVAARLHRGPLPAGEATWEAPALAPGVYWLTARVQGRTMRQAFTVVR